MKLHALAAVVVLGCSGATTSGDEKIPAAPAPSASEAPPPRLPALTPNTGDPAPVPAAPYPRASADRFRCPLDTGSRYGHRAAWMPVAGEASYRVYETEDRQRRLTYESKEPNVFFSTSGWTPTLVEIVSVDAQGLETLVWPGFTQGSTADVFDQILAVGEDTVGPVLQIRDCVRLAGEADYQPSLAVRSLRIPGATELRGIAAGKERRELFLRDADRIFVLAHFTTAGAVRDANGVPRLELTEVSTTAPLGAGAALAFGHGTLYAADGDAVVRIEREQNGWRETARSAPFGHAVERLEVLENQIEIVLAEGASERLVHASWHGSELAVLGTAPLTLQGPLLSAINEDGSNRRSLFLAEVGGTEIVRASDTRIFTVPFAIDAFSAATDQVHVRASDGMVSSWSIGTPMVPVRAFRMPMATIHAQLTLAHEWFIIE